jgi:hypothetical protein
MLGRRDVLAGLTSLAAAAALGACSSSTSPSGTPALSATQADTVAAVLTADADGLSDGATSTGSANSGASFSITRLPGQTPAQVITPLLCHPVRSPLPVVNSDGDLAPDSVRVDFTGCLLNHPFAAESLAGTIDYIDPTPTLTDHQLKRVFTNFLIQKRRIVLADTISDEWNGTQTFSRDSSQAQFSENAFTLVHTFPNGHQATHVRTWSSTFTADTAGTILDDTPLPSGLRNITGTSTWTFGANTWNFSVTTNPALHRNDNCTTVPLFDSGVMTVVVTRPSETTTLTITFTGCGTYTVTRS